ncbi:MAG TPA: hypothetical protein VFZ78_09215 [Flavisolibacter sp.]
MKENKDNEQESRMPAAPTGNASNPSPAELPQEQDNQVLHKNAEKYLRETGNIEDIPDARDQQQADNESRNQR